MDIEYGYIYVHVPVIVKHLSKQTHPEGCVFSIVAAKLFYGIIPPWYLFEVQALKFGNIKISWASIGKIIAGIAMVVISFLIFKSVPGWVKIVALGALVALIIAPPLMMKKRLPAEVEKALKDDDRKGHYG